MEDNDKQENLADKISSIKGISTYRIILMIGILGLGLDDFKQLFGPSELENKQASKIMELEANEKALEKQRWEDSIKSQVNNDVKLLITEANKPLFEKLEAIEKQWLTGGRWHIEDEVALWHANGEAGPDPRDIQTKRLIEEARNKDKDKTK